MNRSLSMEKVLYTIGHSTHSIETFLGLLSQHQMAELVDVRSMPGSRRWPQFNQDEFKAALEAAGISYQWLKVLGGRRHSKLRDSAHTQWQQPAFRSYADYADTSEFADGLERLARMAVARRVAIMCSEGLWWRCHRRIVSDHMIVRGWQVRHIMPDGKLVEHALPDFARVVEGRIIYDRGQPPLERH